MTFHPGERRFTGGRPPPLPGSESRFPNKESPMSTATGLADPAQEASSRRNYRESARFPCHLQVSCHPSTSEDEGLWTAQIANISNNGIALVVRRRFDPWTILDID